MGPYYRGTSQGMGRFIDNFYQHPLLMLLVTIVVICFVIWHWQKPGK
jgi:hypothetical protein